MSVRLVTMRGISLGFAETLVSVENVTKALVKAPAPNCTALGRGNRDVHVGVEWMVSVALGVAINDLKNCVSKVHACSLLRSSKPEFVQYTKSNDLLTGFFPEEIRASFKSKLDSATHTLFDDLCGYVNSLAWDWGGYIHQNLRNGFRLTISTGAEPSALADEFVLKDAGSDWWKNVTYRPEHTQVELPRSVPVRPVMRQAVISVEHLEMLAMLWADTLRHLDPGDAGDLKAPPLHELPELQAEPAPGSKNENAGSFRGEPASTRDQDHNLMIPGPHIPDNERERDRTQAPSRTGRGCPSPLKRMLPDVRARECLVAA